MTRMVHDITLCLMVCVIPMTSLVISTPHRTPQVMKMRESKQPDQNNVTRDSFEQPSASQQDSSKNFKEKVENRDIQVSNATQAKKTGHSKPPHALPLGMFQYPIPVALADLSKRVLKKAENVDRVVIITLAATITVLVAAVIGILVMRSRGGGGPRVMQKMITKRFSMMDDSSDSNIETDNTETSGTGSSSSNEFPNALGPFAVRPTKWCSDDIKIVKERDGSKAWSIARDVFIRKLWSSCDDLGAFANSLGDWPIKGRLEPASCISHFPGTKTVIPVGATTFGWSHPVDLNDKSLSDEMVDEIAKTGVAEVDFLLRGGFVFYNENGSMCEARTFGVSTTGNISVHFESPHLWSEERIYRELRSTRYWNQITIPGFKKKGDIYFSWVNPEEPVRGSAKAAKVLPYGGFVYCVDPSILQGRKSIDPSLIVRGGCKSIKPPTTGKYLAFPLQKVLPPGIQYKKRMTTRASGGGSRKTMMQPHQA